MACYLYETLLPFRPSGKVFLPDHNRITKREFVVEWVYEKGGNFDDRKMKQRLLLAFATVVGFVIGYLNPETSQALLSGIGWIAGIGMFFLFRRSNKNPTRDYTASWAYILIRMLLFFIIGAVLGSMIPYYQQIMALQQQ